MIKKLLKYFRVISIDVFIYSMSKETIAEFANLDLPIQSEIVSQNKKRFFVTIEGKLAHESYLFQKLFLLRVIHEKGPTIGDCKTMPEFKGKSIYPFVINFIAREEILKNHQKEVFIVVNTNNSSSIKGIEKAGFKLHTKIKAKRFLLFHFNTQLTKN
ncbi:hypothetical protein [Flavobacterium sp.]|uniref:hypothetical protein n=1 Tax=Flavobacterium sp. TaxID=239 RepID=UPI00391905EE